jgi:hypothetical protein
VNQQVTPKIINRVDKLLTAVQPLSVVKQPPFRPGSIKNKVDELARKFALVLFQLFNVRRQAQRSARRRVWGFVFRTHRFRQIDLNRVCAFASIKVLSIEPVYSAAIAVLLQTAVIEVLPFAGLNVLVQVSTNYNFSWAFPPSQSEPLMLYFAGFTKTQLGALA